MKNPFGSSPSAPPPSNAPGEFTQMFGNANRPGVTPVQPVGGGGGGSAPLGPPLGSGNSATGAFSIPKTPVVPPPSRGGEPGEFTRMMSAATPMTLGQTPPKVAAAAPPQATPKGPSKLPLYIAGGAVLLVVVLLIVFLALRS
jgi:hypothetical protein